MSHGPHDPYGAQPPHAGPYRHPAANAQAPADVALPCPRCRKLSSSIKSYRLPWLVIYLGVYFFIRKAVHRACPSCTRIVVLQRFAINLLPANIAMTVVGPILLVQFLRTFSHGHSKQVVDELAAARAREAKKPISEMNVRQLLSELPAVLSLLQQGNYWGGLSALRTASARLTRIGDWEGFLDLFLRALAAWDFGGAREHARAMPPPVAASLLPIVDRFSQQPPEEAIGGLVATLSSPDVETRRTAAVALGNIGPRASPAWHALAAAAQRDPDKYVRAFAHDALQSIARR